MRFLTIRFLPVLLILGNIAGLKGQNLFTDTNISPEELVKDVLVSGACLSVDNVRAIGNSSGIGYFNFQGTAPIFKEGILLSTGYIEDAVGPNLSTNISGELYGYTTDPDLDLMATDSLFDVIGLEFDFVPIDSLVEFKFIFASEEYCEFVGSEFNDVFGFFVSGPGINGPFSNNAANVALIPGSNDFVAINSVNHLDNSFYYIQNETRNDAAHCGKFYNPAFIEETEYDGMTLPLRARFRVIPCETYHIRLVVADVADPLLDSGVFLEARSFSLGGEVTVRTIVEETDSVLVNEGCGNAYFLFERVNGINNSADLVFNISVSAGSTAQEGSDYLPIPGTLTIPAFTNQLKLPVEVFKDDQDEPPESIFLEMELPCKCSSIQAELNIQDAAPLDILLPVAEACRDTPTDIYVAPEGGSRPFQYSWSNQETTDTIQVTVANDAVYLVTVTDACGEEASAEVNLRVVDAPSGILAGDITICDIRQEYFLPVELFGNGPLSIHLSINGRDTTISNIGQASYSLPVSEPGIYELKAVSNRLCTGSGQGASLVEKTPLDLKILDCAETDSRAYEFSFSGFGTPLFSADEGATFLPLSELNSLEVNTPHRILIRDENGCTARQTVFLPTSLGYEIDIPGLTVKLNREDVFQPSFNFPTDFIRSVQWSPAVDLSCTDCLNPTVTGTDSRQYQLDIEDQFGCIHTGYADLVVDIRPFFIPNAFSPFNSDGVNDLLSIFIDPQNVSNIQAFEIYDRWGNKLYGNYDFLPNPDSGWDGRSRGREMDPGVYIYRLTIEILSGESRTFSGDVTLVN